MTGWVSFSERDYNPALVEGKRSGTRCTVYAVVEIDDLDAFLADPRRAARLRGALDCPRLGPRAEGEAGSFQLFAPAPDSRRRRISYRLLARDPDGRPLTVSGFKLLEDDPNHDVWRDSSRLLVRILAGHVAADEEKDDDPRVLATGVVRLMPLAFARTVLGMYAGAPRGATRYQLEFLRRLLEVYRGPALPATQFDFPSLTPGATPLQGRPPRAWHELPGRPALRRRIVPFEAGDGCELNLHNLRGHGKPTRSPVLLVGGLAMRANSFYDVPGRATIVDALVDAGHDVWVENWRTSIDLPARDYTLDQAAVHDHPAAVRTVLSETGASGLDAVVHCMGSASFTMSVLARRVPEVRHVVASAVSLHIALDARSRRRLWTLLPVTGLFMRGTDPQWAARAPSVAAAGLAAWARLMMRQYDNPLNAATAYFYGGSAEALWRRDNLDAETLDWLAREFGYAPFSFFRQIRRSASAGRLVPVDGLPELPASFEGAAPPPGTSFTFLSGRQNRFFLPAGQLSTYRQFNELQPDTHHFVPLDGYSHLDVLVGRNAADDVFPHILRPLANGR